MNHAIIDLGSNTIRLSVYSCQKDQIQTIFTRKAMGGLAACVDSGALSQKGIAKACDIVQDLKQDALRFTDLPQVHLFAAASLRNITNQQQAVDQIRQTTGLAPHILPGEDEAMLAFVGASHYTPCRNGLLVDIGGGSTELALIKNSQVTAVCSLPLGSLNLYAQYVTSSTPTPAQRKAIKQAVKSQLQTLDWDIWGKEPCSLMVGAGGTLRAVSKLANELFGPLSRPDYMDAAYVNRLFSQLKKQDSNGFLAVYNSAPDRVLTIIPGLILLRQIIRFFSCKKITISKLGVREGYLINHVLKTQSADAPEADYSFV